MDWSGGLLNRLQGVTLKCSSNKCLPPRGWRSSRATVARPPTAAWPGWRGWAWSPFGCSRARRSSAPRYCSPHLLATTHATQRRRKVWEKQREKCMLCDYGQENICVKTEKKGVRRMASTTGDTSGKNVSCRLLFPTVSKNFVSPAHPHAIWRGYALFASHLGQRQLVTTWCVWSLYQLFFIALISFLSDHVLDRSQTSTLLISLELRACLSFFFFFSYTIG